MARAFYKCPSCLSVVATSGEELQGYNPEVPFCSVCNRKMGFMGKVMGTRLVKSTDAPPCDSRCTNATGPSCDCICRGMNHGSHRLVTIVRDAGGIPKITPPDEALAIQRRDEYQAGKAQVEARIEAVIGKENVESYKAGNRIDYDKWTKLRQLLDQYGDARGLRSHAGRLKALAKIAPEGEQILSQQKQRQTDIENILANRRIELTIQPDPEGAGILVQAKTVPLNPSVSRMGG